jgi:hypothetical protein
MRGAAAWSCFGIGSAGCILGLLLTQAPGRNHTFDVISLLYSLLLLVGACWFLWRARRGVLRNIALTIGFFEVLIGGYAAVSILTYTR